MSRQKRDKSAFPTWLKIASVCTFSAPIAIAAGIVGLAMMVGLVAWDAYLGGPISED